MRALLASCLIALMGCDNIPADPEHTLAQVLERQQLRVGVIEHRPWTTEIDDTPGGMEVSIVAGFAASLGVEPQWEFLSESQAVESLRNQEVDLVIGGLTSANPRKTEAAFTRPYLRTGDAAEDQHVMAVKLGENRFLTTLERYLAQQEQEIQQLYREQRE